MSKIRLLNVEECLMVTGGAPIYMGRGKDGRPRYFVPGKSRSYKCLDYLQSLHYGEYEDAEVIDCGTEREALSRAMQAGARQQGLGNIANFFTPIAPEPLPAPPPVKRQRLITDYFSPITSN